MKSILICLLLCSFCGAKQLNNVEHSIEGAWEMHFPVKTLSDGDMYVELEFKKLDDANIIVLYVTADTVYHYKYYIENNDLVIINDAGGIISRSHVLKLTKDSLELSSLLQYSGTQKYYRPHPSKKKT